MLRLKPDATNRFSCPKCDSLEPTIHAFKFETVNFLADCHCVNCGLDFFQVLPVGHTVDYPIQINKTSGATYENTEVPAWLSSSLQFAHHQELPKAVSVEKVVYKTHKKVIILNTLDTLYGHVLLKLFNAFHHLNNDRDFGLIIIIPKIFQWLIPAGCAEVWIIDLKLEEFKFSYSSLQSFITSQFSQYEEIYMSYAYSHPQLEEGDMERLIGIKPFNLSHFDNLLPVITFILREDRWWLASKIDFWFYRLCRKIKIMQWANRILSQRQNRLIKKTIQLISKELPDANYFLVGLGKTGSFSSNIIDKRTNRITSIIEKSWCEIYAQSHVVIGIHGSNMLLPTAFAAGCVEILPEDRYGNMIQDLATRFQGREQLFFYRFADQYAKPNSVASKAVAIFRDFKGYHRNMSVNQYTKDSAMTSSSMVDDHHH